MEFRQIAIKEIRIDQKFFGKLQSVAIDNNQKLIQEQFEKDVAEHGILVPVMVSQDGLLIDGHKRLDAATKAGKTDVPAYVLPFPSDESWEKTTAIALNLYRRHLNAPQRVAIGTSIEKLERAAAKNRKGQGGGRGKNKHQGVKHPDVFKDEDRATARVAAAVGVGRQTYERVKKVMTKNPNLSKKLLEGKISVRGAHKKVKVQELKEEAAKEKADDLGLIKDLSSVHGRYSCIYADPPWDYDHGGKSGDVDMHYPTLSLDALSKLPVSAAAREDAFLWLWTTWPKIRDCAPHRVLLAWGFKWIGEIVWNKKKMATGRWLRQQTEVLILAKRGNPMALIEPEAGYLEIERGKHSEKPAEARELIEKFCLGPRIELFARKPAQGWDRWGLEA